MRANRNPFPYSANAHRQGYTRRARTRPHATHDANPPGSKLERRFAKVILRRAKDPATSAKVGYDRARVVRAKYHAAITGF